MIFVTVGEQLPFDRLIRTVDKWAAGSGQEVFAQIGDTDLIPNILKYKKFLDPDEFKEKFNSAELIVAHAGMGTIITALEFNKPILVMPRQAALGEHRNDHQFATTNKFMKLNYISAALDETELIFKLNNHAELARCSSKAINTAPSCELIQAIQDFIKR